MLLSAAGALACGRHKATAFRGFCFVANQVGRTVAVVDLTRFRLRREIPLDAAPAAVVAHPSQAKVFVLAPDTGTVYEIDALTLAVSRRARAGNQAAGMQVGPENKVLWVLYRDPPALVELPLDSLRPARRIRLAAPPDSFDLSRENQAAIASRQAQTIVLASLANTTVARTFNAGAEPSLLRYRWDGVQLLVGSRSERVLTIFDVASGKPVVRLPLPVSPRQFCFNADGGQLFISGDGMDAVAIVYPYRTEVAETMLAGRAPDGMAATESPPYLLVTNPETNSVTALAFDNMGRKLVAVVQVGEEPRHIVITPDRQYALVLNQKSGDLAVIRIWSLAQAPNGALRRFKTAPLFTLVPVGEKPVSAAVVAFG